MWPDTLTHPPARVDGKLENARPACVLLPGGGLAARQPALEAAHALPLVVRDVDGRRGRAKPPHRRVARPGVVGAADGHRARAHRGRIRDRRRRLRLPVALARRRRQPGDRRLALDEIGPAPPPGPDEGAEADGAGVLPPGRSLVRERSPSTGRWPRSRATNSPVTRPGSAWARRCTGSKAPTTLPSPVPRVARPAGRSASTGRRGRGDDGRFSPLRAIFRNPSRKILTPRGGDLRYPPLFLPPA